MSHKRWFEDLGAQREHSNQPVEFLRDTAAMAESGEPWAQAAIMDWEASQGFYDEYHGGGEGRSDDPMIAGTEIHARVAEVLHNGERMPDWYRQKWFPNVWSEESRSLNPSPRFDREVPPQMDPIFQMGPDENGMWG
jgi:hypothetical protein